MSGTLVVMGVFLVLTGVFAPIGLLAIAAGLLLFIKESA